CAGAGGPRGGGAGAREADAADRSGESRVRRAWRLTAGRLRPVRAIRMVAYVWYVVFYLSAVVAIPGSNDPIKSDTLKESRRILRELGYEVIERLREHLLESQVAVKPDAEHPAGQ